MPSRVSPILFLKLVYESGRNCLLSTKDMNLSLSKISVPSMSAKKCSLIDYACYCTAIPESEKHIYFQDSKYSNIKKFKLMKLHGSTNWSLCPNCGRVYTGLGMQENIWVKYILGTTCPKCSNFIPSSEGQEIRPPILESFLITPTFVKKFENPHIQMVWHNAYTELCEAERVVFIGYWRLFVIILVVGSYRGSV